MVKIIGGAGISQLANESETICELQKMYFLPEASGLGLGSQLMEKCLVAANSFGYEKCYLETMPYMVKMLKNCIKNLDFNYIDKPMGCTGHTSCPVWMLKEI